MFRSGYKLDLLEPQSLMMLNGVPNDQKTSVKPQTERVVQGNSWKDLRLLFVKTHLVWWAKIRMSGLKSNFAVFMYPLILCQAVKVIQTTHANYIKYKM